MAPMRIPMFRALWLSVTVSNFGWLIQSVGAAWLMTSLAGTADLVALVQTAVQAPIVCLSLVGGAAADVWDRRRVLLIAQLWMLVVSTMLAALTSAGLIGPASLLAFTFALGLGTALQGPAFQSIVRELVPSENLGAAVTLNAVAFNFARAAAPALGGAIVALAGAQAAFLVNAVSYTALILVLLTWRRPVVKDELPRERVTKAIVTGLRYVAEAPAIRVVLLRNVTFSFAAGSALALLPLVAKDVLGGGPVTYGVLLGGFGVGAMVGAFLIHPARLRYGSEAVVRVLTVFFAGMLCVLGLVPSTLAMILALAFGGAAWLGAFSIFNITVQTASAFWVQARVFAVYQTFMFGAMAFGSWLWGFLAHGLGIRHALLLAAAWMAASLLLGLRFRLPTGPVPDLRPSQRRAEPVPSFPFDQDEGPILVLVEYRISPQDAKAFGRAVEEVGHLRKRNGATRWQAFQDVADAEHWVEVFSVASWLDYRRQALRATATDEAIEARARLYHKGGEAPLVRHLIARRLDARLAGAQGRRSPAAG